MSGPFLAVLVGICLLSTAVQSSRAQQSASRLPPDAQYVTVQNGHLSSNGQRVRLWCVIGGFPNNADLATGDSAATRLAKTRRAYADADALAARFVDLGFNGTRHWRYSEADYTRGDGSPEDVNDYFVSVLKKRNFRIWMPSISWVDPAPEDANLVDEPTTADAFRAAVQEARDKNIGHAWIARVWDSRLEAKQRAQITRRLNHRNLYTGLRVADDPIYAVYELTNEEWWMSKMVGGAWQNLPSYFVKQLNAKWHDFLRQKYGTPEKLQARWGFLLPGESLERGSIRIAPLAGNVKLDEAGLDAQARRQLELARSASTNNGEFNRDNLPRARGEDVIQFFLELQLAHKKRLGAHLKSQGKGARLSPLLYDTGIGYEIQSQFLHQNADAVAHDAYVNGWTRNPRQQRFPFFSGLEEWPRIAEDVPWLEHNRTEGKPFLCYETQIQQPAKYRAEFPLRLLALASIQDWDAVCWHYWGSVPDISTGVKPFERAMDVTTGSHPQGYHYTFDEVQNATIRAAAYAFRNNLLSPAANPTTFIYGRRSLFAPESMDYAGSYGKIGLNMLPTTYEYGVRLRIDPTREDDEVRGPVVSAFDSGRHTMIRSTPQILFDTQRGGLTFDAPGVAAFSGFLSRFGPQLRFGSGVTLRDVSVLVPPAMPYKDGLAEEKYISFALVSQDGRPLNTTRSATLSLVSTSFNSNFKIGNDDKSNPQTFGYSIPPNTQSGTLPVLTARVGATIVAPALNGMRYTLRDWHMNVVGRGVVSNGTLRVSSAQPVFCVEFER